MDEKFGTFARAARNQIAQAHSSITNEIGIPEEWKERFLAKVETWEEEASKAKQKKIDALRAELSSLKSKLERLNNAFADGGLDFQEFKEMKNPLVPRRVELEQEIIALERSTANRLEPLENWIIDANQAGKRASENDEFKNDKGGKRLARTAFCALEP